MASTSFSIGSVFLLVVSLIGNWEQGKELGIRSTQIGELKLENQILATRESLGREQLEQLRKESEQVIEQRTRLAKDLDDLRNQRAAAEQSVAVLQQKLRGEELSEDRRMQLVKELAKANGKLEVQAEMMLQKEEAIAKTQHHLHELSMNQCGCFTPRGLLRMVSDWADVSPLTLSILGNLVFSAVAALLWRVLMYPRRSHEAAVMCVQAGHAHVHVPLHHWWPVHWIRRFIVWIVAFFALTMLPLLLKEFAGRQAMDAMESVRSSFCEGAPWCAWGFDKILTPNAILIAEGEAYVHAARGWQRVVMAQTVALVADQAIILVLCVLAWPFNRRRRLAIQTEEQQPLMVEDQETSRVEDISSDKDAPESDDESIDGTPAAKAG